MVISSQANDGSYPSVWVSKAFIAFLLVLAPALHAQSEEDWRSRLENAQGSERLPLIVEYLSTTFYNDPQFAMDLGQEAMDLLDRKPDEHLELVVTCAMCRAQQEARELDGAISQGELCLEKAEQRDEMAWQAWAHLWCLGKSFSKKDELGLAVVHSMHAVELYEELGDTLSQAMGMTWAGMDLSSLGDLTTGLEYQLQAHQLFQALGNRRGEAQALLRTGVIYSDLKDDESALQYSRQALQAFRDIGSDNGAAAALHNMGTSHLILEQYDLALAFFEESLEIKERLEQPRAVALRWLAIGVVYSKQQKPAKAFPLLHRALKQFEDLEYKREAVMAGLQLAKAYQRDGQPRLAIERTRRTIEMAEEIGVEERNNEVYLLLADLEEERGDLSAALAAMRRYGEVKDRFINDSNSRRMTEMAARYQAESQAWEIEELKKQKALQALEVERQRNLRIGSLVGFGLVLAIIALFSYRSRLRAQAEEIKILRGLLPICIHCKNIRDNAGQWNVLEAYVEQRTDATFSHSLCPDCFREHYPDLDYPQSDRV